MTKLRSFSPERQAFINATADILKRGYILTNSDLSEITPHYGYSPSYGDTMLTSYASERALAVRGVKLVVETYKHRLIYFDGSLDPRETDIDDTVQRLDEKIAKVMQDRVMPEQVKGHHS
jgi:hypothetical protein